MLREIDEESVSSLLEKKDALGSCDVAAFVYDRYGIIVSGSLFRIASGFREY